MENNLRVDYDLGIKKKAETEGCQFQPLRNPLEKLLKPFFCAFPILLFDCDSHSPFKSYVSVIKTGYETGF